LRKSINRKVLTELRLYATTAIPLSRVAPDGSRMLRRSMASALLDKPAPSPAAKQPARWAPSA
jgi:hypothetical protein